MNERKERRRKTHFELTGRMQVWRNKRSIEEKIDKVQEFCHRLGLEITHVTIMCLTDKNNKPLINYVNSKNNKDEIKSKRALKALQAKDESNLSDLGYNRFVQNFKYDFELPTLDELVEKRKAIKKFFRVEANRFGVFNKPSDKILFICKNYLRNNGPAYRATFNIKLHGDSINVAKTGIKLLIFAFALIEEEERPMSVEGNYVLGNLFFGMI